MTDAPTPVVLRHGMLTAEQCKLLTPNSALLHPKFGLSFWHPTEDAPTLTGPWSYVGERDADGWITAPEGGWKSPAPFFGMDCEMRVMPGGDWRNPQDVVAFRLSDQPVENSPSPALGGTERVSAPARGRFAP